MSSEDNELVKLAVDEEVCIASGQCEGRGVRSHGGVGVVGLWPRSCG